MSQTKVKSGLIDFTEGIDSFIEFSGGNSTVTGDLTVSGTLTGYTPTSGLNISNWNTAYGWGNHASAGYLTSFDITTQTDSKYLRSDESDTMSGSLTVTGGLTVDTNTLFVDSSNDRVGIGTTSPARQLHVSNTTTGIVRVEGTNTNGEAVYELYGKNSSGTQRSLILKYDNADIFRISTAQAVPIRFETNDIERVRIGSDGHFILKSTTAGGGTQGDFYVIENGGLVIDSSEGATQRYIEFTTGNSTKMLITAGGDVGIGKTTGIDYKLDVTGQIRVNGTTNEQLIVDYTTASGGFTWQSFRLNGTNKYRFFGNTDNSFGLYSDTTATQVLTISSTGAATFGGTLTTNDVLYAGSGGTGVTITWGSTLSYIFSPPEKALYLGVSSTISNGIYINTSGKVGIGTTSPTLKLDLSSDSFGLPATSGTTPVGFARIGYTDRSWGGNEILMGIINSGASDYAGFIQCKVPTDYAYNRAFLINPQGGNVGIGTASPEAKLHVAGEILTTSTNPLIRLSPESGTSAFIQKLSAANGDYLRIYDGTQYTATFKNGSVGIGTTSPGVKLDVQTSNTGTGLGDGMILKLKNTSTTNNTRSGIIFGNIDGVGGALAMQSAILKNSVTGEYDMTWDLYGGVAGWKEALLYLDSNPGNVGIGTTSPSTKLHVVGGDIYTDSQFRLNQGQGITWNNGDNYIKGISGYHLQFTTYDGASAQQEVLRLTGGSAASGGGRVGIGTNSPQGKLDVNGLVVVNQLVIRDEYSTSHTISSDWSASIQEAIPAGILSNNGTYLIVINWTYNANQSAPYFVQASGIISLCNYVNNSGWNNEVELIGNAHISGNYTFFMSTGGGSNTSARVGIRTSFPTTGGTLYIYAKRLT